MTIVGIVIIKLITKTLEEIHIKIKVACAGQAQSSFMEKLCAAY